MPMLYVKNKMAEASLLPKNEGKKFFLGHSRVFLLDFLFQGPRYIYPPTRQFQQRYSDKVCLQLEEWEKNTSIGLSMSMVKPLSVNWMIGVHIHDYLKSHPDIRISQQKN